MRVSALIGDDERAEAMAADEVLGDPVVDQGDQGVEVAVDVEDPDRLAVDARGPPSSGSRRTPRTSRSRRGG